MPNVHFLPALDIYEDINKNRGIESMLINEKITLSTSKLLLVPYCKHHVPRYHEWMQDPDMREATASDSLTIEEEYAMQESWRKDANKLTFIICQSDQANNPQGHDLEQHDSATRMLGDVNLFLSVEHDDEDEKPGVIGELELMIAQKHQHRKGYGRTALLMFLLYITSHAENIIAEFLQCTNDHGDMPSSFKYLGAKVGVGNYGSLVLFGSMGFKKTSDEANYFGEYHLKHEAFTTDKVREMMASHSVLEYRELSCEAMHGAPILRQQ